MLTAIIVLMFLTWTTLILIYLNRQTSAAHQNLFSLYKTSLETLATLLPQTVEQVGEGIRKGIGYPTAIPPQQSSPPPRQSSIEDDEGSAYPSLPWENVEDWDKVPFGSQGGWGDGPKDTADQT